MRRVVSRLIARVRKFIKKKRLGAVNEPHVFSATKIGEFVGTPPLLFYKGHKHPLSLKDEELLVPNLIINEADESFGQTMEQVMLWHSYGVDTVVIVDVPSETLYAYPRKKAPKSTRWVASLSLEMLPGFEFKPRDIFPSRPSKDEKPPKNTLFDMHLLTRMGPLCYWSLHRLNSGNSGVKDREVEIFYDVAKDDRALDYNTDIAGLITLKLENQTIDCSREKRRPIQLSGWFENDRLKFVKTSARGILYVASNFIPLWRVRAWEELKLIVIGGHGIPRLMTRRLLHRMSTELNLPVYVLSESETWAYYIFSVLKRGALAAHLSAPEFAVNDVRFLGLRAGELKLIDNPKRYLIRWQEHWDLQLNAMATYPCFQSAAWRKEFAAFRKQRGEVHLAGLAVGLARKYGRQKNVWGNLVSNYLVPKLKKQDWLT